MKKLLLGSAFLSALVLFTYCKKDDDVDPGEKTPFINPDNAEVYKGTQSPGDVWSWTLDKQQGHMTATWDYGTFDDTSDDITVKGEFEKLPSGFLKVTIISSEPESPEIPTDGSAWFYAIEIPGMAMIIKPEGSIKGDIIAMVPEGDCNNIPGAYNYIVTAPGGNSNYDPVTEEAFGYVDFTASGSGFSISGYKFSLDCVDGGACTESGNFTGLPVAACAENGAVKITENGSTIAEGQFTNAGAMMLDFGKGNGGIFALKAQSSANMDALKDNAYNGIAYLPKSTNDKTMPVKLDFFENSLGTLIGTGYPYTSLENSTVSETENIVVVVDTVINGRVLGKTNFDNDSDNSKMAAALLVNGPDQILILSSYDEESLDPFILVLAKEDE